jgi:predicted AAA+ superfamily ATPase
LLGLIVTRSSALMNMSELSRSTGIANSTLRRYLGLLEAIYILQPLPAWATNTGKQELRKQLTWGKQSATPFHYRSAAGREVDLVLELPGGVVAGVEIKAAAKVGKVDFAGLEALAEDAGKKFIRGVLLYFGDHVLPFGDNLAALPITELWSSR